MCAKRGHTAVFYLSRRVNGKPTKIYVGTGIEAEKLVPEVEIRKRARLDAAEACVARNVRTAAAVRPDGKRPPT